jgi:xylulokinase
LKKSQPVDSVVASGGATYHPLWLQLQADIFNLPVFCSQSREPAATGAAMLAAVGMGIFQSLNDAIRRLVVYESPVLPNEENVEIYSNLFPNFLSLYPSLKPFSHRL